MWIVVSRPILEAIVRHIRVIANCSCKKKQNAGFAFLFVWRCMNSFSKGRNPLTFASGFCAIPLSGVLALQNFSSLQYVAVITAELHCGGVSGTWPGPHRPMSGSEGRVARDHFTGRNAACPISRLQTSYAGNQMRAFCFHFMFSRRTLTKCRSSGKLTFENRGKTGVKQSEQHLGDPISLKPCRHRKCT